MPKTNLKYNKPKESTKIYCFSCRKQIYSCSCNYTNKIADKIIYVIVIGLVSTLIVGLAYLVIRYGL